MKPLPWSHSALSDFKNCPKQYHHKRVLKDLPPEVKGPQQLWGLNVHKEFEDRQGIRQPLPLYLRIHEPFMKTMEGWPGTFMVERRIALDKRALPISDYFSRDVWYRGVMDYEKINPDESAAKLVDYKTGKKKEDWSQLAINAVHTFASHPNVNIVDARFYWTVDQTVSRKVWNRDEIPMLWGMVLGDLRQYAEAFKADVWQPRTSGLCHGWCPVTKCDHWRPKKQKV